jgi:hypothetical protein
MSDEQIQKSNDLLRRAAKRSAIRIKETRRRIEEQGLGSLWLPEKYRQPEPAEEHYHVVYAVPKDNLRIPGFGEVFMTARDCYARIKEMGDAGEPQTEWYDDGRVGIETTLHGRVGLWWIEMEVAPCIASKCVKNMTRNQRKRRLVLLKGRG